MYNCWFEGCQLQKMSFCSPFSNGPLSKTKLVSFRTRFAFLLSRYSFVLAHDRSPSISVVSQSICSLQTQLVAFPNHMRIWVRSRYFSASWIFGEVSPLRLPESKRNDCSRLYYYRQGAFLVLSPRINFPTGLPENWSELGSSFGVAARLVSKSTEAKTRQIELTKVPRSVEELKYGEREARCKREKTQGEGVGQVRLYC